MSLYSQPAVVLKYNKYKGGVDVTDQVTKKFSCQRATRRWSKALFENFVDISIHNGYLMFNWANPVVKHTKREFIEWLAKEMAIAHVGVRRKNVVGIHTEVIGLMDNFLQNFEDKYGLTTRPTAACCVCDSRTNLLACMKCKKAIFCEDHFVEKKLNRCKDCSAVSEGKIILKSGSRRCGLCPRNADRKTPVYCHNCEVYMCALHKKTTVRVKLCEVCSVEAAPRLSK